MATRLSSIVIVLFSLGVCAGEGLDLDALWEDGLPVQATAPPLRATDEASSGVFAREPSHAVLRKGADALLECAAAPAFASWTLSWRRDNLHLPANDKRFVVDGTGALNVRQVTRSGEYRCALTNPEGKETVLSRAASLQVATMSHAIHGPHNISVPVGATARFSCSVDSVPSARITWKKNNKPLPADSRYVTLSSGVLLISAVDPSDVGAYKCVATNNVLQRSRPSTDAFLSIGTPSGWSPTTFLSQEKRLQSVQGENVTLECSVSGNHLPTWSSKLKSSWFNQSVSNWTVPGISLLTLPNINSNHAGTYSCFFNSSTQTFSQEIQLEVSTPPSIIEPPGSQTYPTARTARFNCNVSGNPFPTVVWFKDGVRLIPDGRVKPNSPELVITDSIAADSGFYQCMVQNNVGESWGLAHLYINASDVPSPTNVTCEMHSDNFIILHWSALKTNDDLVVYTVHWYPTSNKTDRHSEITGESSVNITGLKPLTNYTFSVRTYGRQASEFSKEILCTTKESVPNVAPNISWTILSPRILNVSWVPLEPIKIYGQAIGYKVQWHQVTKVNTKVKELPSDVLHFIVTDLVPGTVYEIRVLARTGRGWPPRSVADKLAWSSVEMPLEASAGASLVTPPETQKDVVNIQETLEAPTGLEAESTSPYAINLTWSAPSVDCEYYSVLVREVHSTNSVDSAKSINCTNFWMRIDDLQPNTIYELMLKVHGSNGYSSPFSEKIECQTLEDVPDVVTDISWEPLGQTTIKVVWKEPSSPVTQFNISLVALNKSHTIVLLINGTLTSTEIFDIKPVTFYQLTVSGITRAGIGPRSETHIVYLHPPEVVQSPTGEHLGVPDPDPHDYSLMFGVTSSIIMAIVLLLVLIFLSLYRSFRRNSPANPMQVLSPYQLNGHGIHGQLPLTSFVTSDPNILRHHLGVRREDAESHDGSDSRAVVVEESSVTLLPPGTTPTPIGANSVHVVETPDRQETLPHWSGKVLLGHVVHITENLQFESNDQPPRYGHDIDDGDSEEMATLLTANCQHNRVSAVEDCSENGEDDVLADSLNVTQVTEADHSFQDKSNSCDIHSSNISMVSSLSMSDGCQSSGSISLVEESDEDRGVATQQTLLVTLSAVPCRLFSRNCYTNVDNISVVGPNG